MPKSHQVLALSALVCTVGIYVLGYIRRKKPLTDVTQLIGNTALVKLNSLSNLLGCNIYAKVEYLNVGGSPKDRVALSIINQAEVQGKIIPHAGYTLYEGTVGSTGISLALIARQKGYHCNITMPDDVAKEKYILLKTLGCTVELVKPASIVDPNHFVNLAKIKASKDPKGYFCNQFEIKANFDAHYNGTGREIYECLNRVDAVIMGAGTGGTLAGVGHYLKQRGNTKVYLADPQGSGLFHKVESGVMYSETEQEGSRKRHQVDTIVEGIGLTRLTNNFKSALPVLDGAFKVTDQEAVSMARFLVDQEGIFIGSSTAVNCAAVVKLAREMGSGNNIVTILCDSGQRHLTKFWNDEVLSASGFDIETPKSLEFVT